MSVIAIDSASKKILTQSGKICTNCCEVTAVNCPNWGVGDTPYNIDFTISGSNNYCCNYGEYGIGATRKTQDFAESLNGNTFRMTQIFNPCTWTYDSSQDWGDYGQDVNPSHNCSTAVFSWYTIYRIYIRLIVPSLNYFQFDAFFYSSVRNTYFFFTSGSLNDLEILSFPSSGANCGHHPIGGVVDFVIP